MCIRRIYVRRVPVRLRTMYRPFFITLWSTSCRCIRRLLNRRPWVGMYGMYVWYIHTYVHTYIHCNRGYRVIPEDKNLDECEMQVQAPAHSRKHAVADVRETRAEACITEARNMHTQITCSTFFWGCAAMACILDQSGCKAEAPSTIDPVPLLRLSGPG
jgi:hypothetical protein